jgi:uncharacterized protein YgbK (DUF1537 family)
MTDKILLGCIADDFTGATDLANMLVRGGMRTVQTIGIPVASLDQPAEAVVIALKSRTAPANEAVAQSLAALQWLRARGCRQFYFKYCSTFDSTDAGNIGPVTSALMHALQTDFTIACPAFPENGRSVYRGHLFVADTLLNESGMEHHPLTPMTDANLVRVLQRQTERKIGLLRFDTIAIADAISDSDLYSLGEACADLPLLTGGSGLALGLPGNFQRAGLLPAAADAARLPALRGRAAVLSGSCSRTTNGQVAHWKTSGRPAYKIDPMALADGEPVVENALAFAAALPPEEPVLIYATSEPEEVRTVQQRLGVAESGAQVERALASIARLLADDGVNKFVVAGGETSGAVVQALGVTALRIGMQIDPGVPWTVSLGDRPIALALKSGNFGAPDFFAKALRLLQQSLEPS